MEVAEEQVFLPAEVEKRHWHGRSRVDAEVPDVRVLADIPRVGAAVSEQTHRVTEVAAVHEFDRLVHVADRYDPIRGPKISSRTIFISSSTSPKTVALRKFPSS